MNTTIGVFTTHVTAEKGIQELRNSGINESDLSYLYKDNEGDLKDGQTGDKVASASTVGATTGIVVGGIAGLIIANGILPGLGTLVVGGSLAQALGVAGATALAGAGTGAIAGGVVGALTHLGVKSDHARLYEEQVQNGGVLVIAKSDNSGVKEIFTRNGAHEVEEYVVS